MAGKMLEHRNVKIERTYILSETIKITDVILKELDKTLQITADIETINNEKGTVSYITRNEEKAINIYNELVKNSEKVIVIHHKLTPNVKKLMDTTFSIKEVVGKAKYISLNLEQDKEVKTINKLITKKKLKTSYDHIYKNNITVSDLYDSMKILDKYIKKDNIIYTYKNVYSDYTITLYDVVTPLGISEEYKYKRNNEYGEINKLLYIRL